MRKFFFLALGVILVFCLLNSSFIAAADHSKKTQGNQKLYGHGLVSKYYDVGSVSAFWVYCITNPDSVHSIIIEKVSIYNWDGSLLFEGKLSDLLPSVDDDVLEPHEGETINMVSIIEMFDISFWHGNIEILSSCDKKTCPLIGWGYKISLDRDGKIQAEGIVPMDNIKQK